MSFLFYDPFSFYKAADVIELFTEQKIAMITIPAHNSDRLQHRYLFVFGTMKHFSNAEFDRFVQKEV